MKMLKLKLVSLMCVGLLGFQAHAQKPLSEADAQANAANKELAQKSGKVSLRQKAELAKAEKAETNQQGTVTYLAANKIKPGVVTLASGVQYKVLKAGVGKRATDANSVRCRYQGILVDGTSFDKTDDKTPSVLRVAGLLPGLQEVVKLMPVGSKWEVVVPPELAYGAKGHQAVGPNAVLIYVIEIAGIV
jgi:FKBP-type peptidyl-prolyl cis-trans isomerase